MLTNLIHKIIVAPFALICIIAISGCKKFIQVEAPPTDILSINVFKDDNSANAAVAGMYSLMYNNNQTFNGLYLTILSGLASDELIANGSSTFSEFQTNSILPNNNSIAIVWQNSYAIIYNANAVIEGLQQSSGVSEQMRKQLKGEAFFIRAFCHFLLTNYFEDVPLVTTTDVRITAGLARISKSAVYEQIISDLQEAQNLLSSDYSYSGGERVRANKWAATALLARVYLYTGQWGLAGQQATEVINNSVHFSLLTDLNSVFIKNSREAIWQILSYGGQGYTFLGGTLIPSSAAAIPSYELTPSIMNSFESNDLRKQNWTKANVVSSQTYYYPYKYKQRIATSGPASEYDMVLRLSEQYLIRAEAKARQEDISGAQSDLNMIRTRAGLPNTTANDKGSLLIAIEHERKVELFSEWGHRWLDLKRLERADAILAPLKAPNWQATDILYPIPEIEINRNPNLTQNNGY